MKALMALFHKFKSLSSKALIIIIVFITLPTVTIGSYMIFQFNEIFNSQAIDYTQRALRTIENNLNEKVQAVEDISTYMIFNEDFQQFMKLPDNPSNYKELKSLERGIMGYLTFHLTSKQYINSIMIEGINGKILSLGDPAYGEENVWLDKADSLKGKIVWSNAYTVNSYWDGSKKVISLFRQLNDNKRIEQKVGRVRIRLNEKSIASLIAQGLPERQGTVFLLSNNGTVYIHNDQALEGQIYPDDDFVQAVTNNGNISFNYEIDNNEYLVVTNQLGNTDLKLVALVNQKEVLKDLAGVRSSILNMVVIYIILGILALIAFNYFIIRPIIELTRETKKVAKGDFSARVKVRTDDEIGKLGKRFNKMVATIQNLIETKYQLQIKQRESELKALQNQIDPHFLYNTLDMIRWTARMENALETSRLIEVLSTLFRTSLSKGKSWIPLDKELLYVQSYLELQKKRLGNKFIYSITYDHTIEKALILKQTLQPLVENSIVHGFADIDYQGIIRIRCYGQDNQLVIDVIDNGSGINNQQKPGFGLSNVNERLTGYFGQQHQLLFQETKQGTAIQILLPILWNEDEVKQMIGKVE